MKRGVGGAFFFFWGGGGGGGKKRKRKKKKKGGSENVVLLFFFFLPHHPPPPLQGEGVDFFFFSCSEFKLVIYNNIYIYIYKLCLQCAFAGDVSKQPLLTVLRCVCVMMCKM